MFSVVKRDGQITDFNLSKISDAIMKAFDMNPEIKKWKLDTILQEKGNLHLYEKLGYRQTGKIEKISDIMDIVYYEKN